MKSPRYLTSSAFPLAPRSAIYRWWIFCVSSAVCCLCVRAPAQNQTITGNLTVTGTIGAAGAIDSDANTLSFGTQSGSFGGALIHQDNGTDTFTFLSNRNPASWLWQHTVSIAAMRLDSAHQLILYKADGTTAGLTFTPANNSIKLGTHANGTLTADANGVITAGGGFSVAGGITNTNGAITGGAAGLTLNAGGTNQSISLNSSGGDLVFSANAAERMRIKAGGNVGIGTVAPAERLHINGNLYADMGEGFRLFGDVNYFGTAADGIVFEMRDSNATGGATDGGFVFRGYTPTDSVAQNWMVIKTPGLVGIGTLNPGTDLDLQRSAFAQARIYSTAVDSTAALQIRNDAQIWQLKTDGADADKFKLVNGGGTVALSVTPTINVGIGTTVPGEKLQVKGNLAFESANTSVFRIVPEPTTNDRILQFENGSSTATGGFAFKATDAGFNAVRLKINNNGNVGIGTASPTARFEVSQVNSAGWSGNLKAARIMSPDTSYYLDLNTYIVSGGNVGYQFSPSGNTGFVVTTPGNVGIGTTSPGAKLEVQDNSAVSTTALILRNEFGTGADQKTVGLGFRGGNGYWATIHGGQQLPNDWGYGKLMFATRTSDVAGLETKMTILADGNVGIGTTTPTHKLAVNGAIRAKEVIVDTGWADYVFEEDYPLTPLAEVEQHIREKKHLPGIPSAAEVAEHGVSMGEMQAKLLAKVEELTLHLIRMEKENAALRDRVQALEAVASTP